MRKIIHLSLIWCAVAALWLLLPTQEGFAQCSSGCSSIIAVPEPASLSLLVSGVAATLFALRRRRK
jgi:hypothetical protein